MFFVSLQSCHVELNSGDVTAEVAALKAQLSDYGLGWVSQAAIRL